MSGTSIPTRIGQAIRFSPDQLAIEIEIAEQGARLPEVETSTAELVRPMMGSYLSANEMACVSAGTGDGERTISRATMSERSCSLCFISISFNTESTNEAEIRKSATPKISASSPAISPPSELRSANLIGLILLTMIFEGLPSLK